MEELTWTGAAGPYLNPVMLAAVAALIVAVLAQIVLGLFTGTAADISAQGDTLVARRSPLDLASLAVRASLLAIVTLLVLYLVVGIVTPGIAAKGIVGAVATQFLPVWLALAVTFGLCITFKRKLGLLGKLMDSPVGMIGLALVMFWVFTALFADLIITMDPIAQIGSKKNLVPGLPPVNAEDAPYPYFLLGGDHLARDVFSRVVMGARRVLLIAPAATAFAFMVGVTLGLPAGYVGGKFDTILSFLSNLVLAFPVILLFYLLVTPEIADTRFHLLDFLLHGDASLTCQALESWSFSAPACMTIPEAMAGILFLFPIIFLTILWNSRYFTQPAQRNVLVGVTVVAGLWLYFGLAFDADPLGLVSLPSNILIVFVSVVFVNSPTVFRIVRGLVMDIKARDYVAAGQTRGEGPWYIMLWEILPNARGPLIVDFCLRIGYTTILLGTLGFFGLGVSPESPDWGSTIDDGRKLLPAGILHPAVAPALALMSLVLGLNLLADGLREESLKD
jgi:peptide/nickel transport system permease protein